MNRREEHDLSTRTIYKLRDLLNIVKAVPSLSQEQCQQPVIPLKYSSSLEINRKYVSIETMIVGPMFQDTAKALLASIKEELQRISKRGYQDWSDGLTDQNRLLNKDSAHQHWNLGTVVFRLECSPIMRGFMELRKSEPICPDISEAVVQYLLTIPNSRDRLKRENHGHWGYHYHYLDSKERRSDTLLTFDRSSSNAINPTLFWERHSENNGFKARAEKWGDGKRENVYGVCYPDTLRFTLKDFKHPASDAKIVWA